MQFYLLLLMESQVLLRRSFHNDAGPAARTVAKFTYFGPMANAWSVWIVLAVLGGFDPRQPFPLPTGAIVAVAILIGPAIFTARMADPAGTRHLALAQQLGLPQEGMLARAAAYWSVSFALFVVAVVIFNVWGPLR